MLNPVVYHIAMETPSGDGMYAALRVLEHCVIPEIGLVTNSTKKCSITNEQLPNEEKTHINRLKSIKEAHQIGHRTVVRYSGLNQN